MSRSPGARSGRSAWPSTRFEDMRVLFDGLPLDKISTSMTINAPAATLLLMYQLVAGEQGIPGSRLFRHDSERRAQGVHSAGHLHLPAA